MQQLDNAPEHKGGKFKKFIMAFVLLAFVGTEVFVLAKGSEVSPNDETRRPEFDN